MTYAFAWQFTYEQTRHECSLIDGETVSSETIADRFSFCREVCAIALDRRYEAEGLLGGLGITVEIDECKIGRRKFEKRSFREGMWILGMFFLVIILLKIVILNLVVILKIDVEFLNFVVMFLSIF